ncbi:MAG: hypothetical protein ACREJ3_19650 [Polyangiaceae bacterium]
MKKRKLAALACLAAMPMGIVASGLVAGCSSSSNGAAPSTDSGSPASDAATDATAPDAMSASPDGGALSLTWGTVLVPANAPQQADAGTDASADAGGSSDADAVADAGGSSDAGAVADATTYTGSYNGNDGGPPAVPGVQICVFPYSAIEALGGALPAQNTALSCVNSGVDGTFVIPSVPARTSLVLTLNKTGFIPIALSIQTASSPMDVRQYPVYMFETSSESSTSSGLMVDWQNKGQIIAFAAGAGGDAGAAARVFMNTQGDGAAPSGAGPIYQNSNCVLDPSATGFFPATGALGISFAQYFNVSAGTYTLTMMDSANDCESDLMPLAAWGFPVVNPAHSIQVAVFKGYTSGFVGFICTPQSVLVSVDGG